MMRALTIQQPMASAVIDGHKRVEWRTRAPGPLPIEVAIHAGSGWWSPTGIRRRPDPQGLAKGAEYWPPGEMPDPDTMPLRAILGTAWLVEVVRPEPGVVGWVLGPVRRLDTPIRWHRGQLGLWRLPDDAAAWLEAALVMAA